MYSDRRVISLLQEIGVAEENGEVVLLHCLALKVHFTRFGERYRDGQHSLVSFSFAVLQLTVPTCPAICKSRETCPPCPMESAPLILHILGVAFIGPADSILSNKIDPQIPH